MSEGDVSGKWMTCHDAVARFVRSASQLALGGLRSTETPWGSSTRSCGRGSGTSTWSATRTDRPSASSSALECEDYSNFQMSLRFLAGSLGIPFIPTKSGLGTDILRRDGFLSPLTNGT
jgi:hypothetical protein